VIMFMQLSWRRFNCTENPQRMCKNARNVRN